MNFEKTWNMGYFKSKNLCDESSKIKNLKWQFSCIFRCRCHSVFCFFCWLFFMEKFALQNCLFSKFSKKAKISQNVGLFFYFFGTPFKWFFFISSSPWQFLTRRKKPHAISIKNERVRSPRVRTFWWHSPNIRDVRPGECQPYVPCTALFVGKLSSRKSCSLWA